VQRLALQELALRLQYKGDLAQSLRHSERAPRLVLCAVLLVCVAQHVRKRAQKINAAVGRQLGRVMRSRASRRAVEPAERARGRYSLPTGKHHQVQSQTRRTLEHGPGAKQRAGLISHIMWFLWLLRISSPVVSSNVLLLLPLRRETTPVVSEQLAARSLLAARCSLLLMRPAWLRPSSPVMLARSLLACACARNRRAI
jgi:hypothetical protein